MRVCSIASGSSGNCIYVQSGNTDILIDAGISCKRILTALAQIGVAPEGLDAILVTHEHADHIRGIYVTAKRLGLPIFATGGTLDAIRKKDKNGDLSTGSFFQIHADCPFFVGDMEVMPFHMSHDAAEPVCFAVQCSGKKFGMATDLGMYDDYTIRHLADCDILLLEANHDVAMLEAGRYPYALKRRILSETGHLSNEAAGKLLCRLSQEKLKYAFLAHLSRENNYPQLAYRAVKCQIWEETGQKDLSFSLQVAEREKISSVVTV